MASNKSTSREFRRNNYVPSTSSKKPSLVQRGDGNFSTIESILQRHQRGLPLSTGLSTGRQQFYADVSGFDYVDTLNRITRMNSEFMALPSDIRARFGNSPARLADFLANEENRPEAEKLGFIPPKQAPEPSFADQVAEGVAKALKASQPPERGA